MADATRSKAQLTGIAREAWEHPADRAALQALRAVPGFDELLRRIVGLIGERGVRLLFQANAVRVGATQMPRVHRLYGEVLATLDCQDRPELFVSQTPVVNAGAYGLDRPFIVLNSGTIALLDDDELAFVLGHELGHVMSGHALYHTMLRLILWAGQSAAPSMIGMIRLPLQIGLLEWYRKSELSCDRAGLLAVQEPLVATRALLKLAGGGGNDALDVDAFLAQGREQCEVGNVLDRVFKILNTIGRTHPLYAPRAADLHEWAHGADYARILRGDYPHRGAPIAPAAFAEASSPYADQVRTVATEVVQGARQLVELAQSAVQSVGIGRKPPD